jgi:hypothetical protein
MSDSKYQVEKTNTVAGKGEYKILASSQLESPNQVDWFIFCNGYLEFSRLGCEYLLKKTRWSSNDRHMIVCMFYNLKHGLEVVVKALVRTLPKQVDKNDYDHDVKKLFKKFKDMPELNKVKNKKDIFKEINKLEKFIENYYGLKSFEKYFNKCFNLADTNNTLFRYPENSAVLLINYSKLLNQFTPADLRNVKMDIIKILMIVKKIKSLIKEK